MSLTREQLLSMSLEEIYRALGFEPTGQSEHEDYYSDGAQDTAVINRARS